MLVGIWLALKIDINQSAWKWPLATGCVLGFATLTRGEGLFYIPAIIGGVFLHNKKINLKKAIATAVLILAGSTLIIGSWYTRNQIVFGWGAPLSASAGHNLYFAHNESDAYGYVPSGTPLYGLPIEQQHEKGIQLALEYVRSSPLSLIKDTRTGIIRLYGAPDYAMFFAIQDIEFPGDLEFEQKQLPFTTLIGQINRALAVLLTSLTAASVLAWRRWPTPLRTFIAPLIVSSIALRTILFWAMPRYRFFVDNLSVFLATITLIAVYEWSRTKATDPQLASS